MYATIRVNQPTPAQESDVPGVPHSRARSSGKGKAAGLSGEPIVPDHELLHHIGRGSYGEVWLARNILGTYRAVKIVFRAQFEDEQPYEREFKGIQKFEPVSRAHEGLVDVLQVGRNDQQGYFYYVMELADPAENPKAEFRGPKEIRSRNSEQATEEIRSSGFGVPSDFGVRASDFYAPRTLRQDLKRDGRLPVKQCIQIGLELAEALAHLHEHGLVHRDVKPSNIIFVGGVVKLADIGVVADVSEARSFVGTDGFIPPEGPGTPQADLYSLGKVLYEISTGFDRRDFPALPPGLKESPDRTTLSELNEVMVKACANDPRQRYASARALAGMDWPKSCRASSWPRNWACIP